MEINVRFYTKMTIALLAICFVMPAFANNSNQGQKQNWNWNSSSHFNKHARNIHALYTKKNRNNTRQIQNTRQITEFEQFFLATQDLLVANDGDILLTFISKDAAHSSDLFLTGSSNAILNNQNTNPGQVFNLGSFVAGTKIAFEIFNNTTGFRYFTGLPSLNPDNTLHAFFKLLSEDTIQIGFEDLFQGGDKDYDDLVFKISNVRLGLAGSVPVIPEPQTYLLMLAGLLLFTRLKSQRK